MASTNELATNRDTDQQQIDTRYLYLVAMVAAVGGFLFGYDLSLISGAILFLKTEFSLTPFWFGFVTGSAVLGCPFGPLAGVWLADTLGRKRTLLVASILFMVSAVGSAVSPDMLQFCVWRFVGGLGVGLASTVSPMYIAEIAPAHLRGRLVVVNQLAIVVGLSLAVCATYFLSFGGHWRWMFASEAEPIGFLMIGLAFVPHSPRWLAVVLPALAHLGAALGGVRFDRRVHAQPGAVVLGAAFRDIPQPYPRQGHVAGHLRHVPGLLLHGQPFPHHARMVQNQPGRPGRNLLDFRRCLLLLYGLCLAGCAGDQRPHSGRNRPILVAAGGMN